MQTTHRGFYGKAAVSENWAWHSGGWGGSVSVRDPSSQRASSKEDGALTGRLHAAVDGGCGYLIRSPSKPRYQSRCHYLTQLLHIKKSNAIKKSFCVSFHGYATLEQLKWKEHSGSLYLQSTATTHSEAVGVWSSCGSSNQAAWLFSRLFSNIISGRYTSPRLIQLLLPIKLQPCGCNWPKSIAVALYGNDPNWVTACN